jgi:hypothetical protein
VRLVELCPDKISDAVWGQFLEQNGVSDAVFQVVVDGQQDREGTTAAKALASIRTENAPTAKHQFGGPLSVAAQQAGVR